MTDASSSHKMYNSQNVSRIFFLLRKKIIIDEFPSGIRLQIPHQINQVTSTATGLIQEATKRPVVICNLKVNDGQRQVQSDLSKDHQTAAILMSDRQHRNL